MTRQEEIKYLGYEGEISIFEGKRNFLSYVIIPIPQDVFTSSQNEIFESIKNNG